MIKGVVFDMDGLMFDTERLAMEGWEYAGRQTGVRISRALLLKTRGLNAEGTKRVFLERFGGDIDYAALRALRLRYVDEVVEKNGMPVKPGLRPLLAFLRENGYGMTVATSTDEAKTRYNLAKAGVEGYFQKIVCGDMVARGKPEPDIYLKACEVLGLAPAACMALEDSPAGILAAYRAGMRPVMVPDTVQPDAATEKLLYAKLPALDGVIGLLEQKK